MDIHNTSDLTELYDLQMQLKRIKKQEMDLRVACAIKYFNDTAIGTSKLNFDKFDVKYVNRVNTRLEEDALIDAWDDLSDWEKACIKMKPTLINSVYSKTPKQYLDHLDNFIVVSPGAPSIEFSFPTLED
jgi:hypothetical protein